jgi:hypothetical protein
MVRSSSNRGGTTPLRLVPSCDGQRSGDNDDPIFSTLERSEDAETLKSTSHIPSRRLPIFR